jgi:hypothetical protein
MRSSSNQHFWSEKSEIWILFWNFYNKIAELKEKLKSLKLSIKYEMKKWNWGKIMNNFWISVFSSCFIFNFNDFNFSFSSAILFQKFQNKIQNFYFWPQKMHIGARSHLYWISYEFLWYIQKSGNILSFKNFLDSTDFVKSKYDSIH